MALTEQDFLDTINENVYADEDGVARTEAYVGGQKEAAEAVYNQHLAECERIAELAFRAGADSENAFWQFQKGVITVFEREKRYFPTYQKYKDSL